MNKSVTIGIIAVSVLLFCTVFLIVPTYMSHRKVSMPHDVDYYIQLNDRINQHITSPFQWITRRLQLLHGM